MPQCRIDNGENAFKIAVDIVVPEPQHLEPVAFKTLIAHSIAARVLIEIVLTAVNLDDEAMSHTNEIDDQPATRRLATEAKSALPPGT